MCICGPGPLDLLLKSEKVSKIERVIVVVVKWFHLSVLSRVLRRSRHVGFHWAAYTVPGLKKVQNRESKPQCNKMPAIIGLLIKSQAFQALQGVHGCHLMTSCDTKAHIFKYLGLMTTPLSSVAFD